MFKIEDVLFGCLIALITIFITFRFQRRRLYKFASKLPGPKEWPIFGILPNFMDVFKTLNNVANQYDESFKTWAGPILIYVIRDPDDLGIVLKKVSEKHELYSKVGFPQGLFTLNGEKHKLHRRLLMPAFSVKSFQSYISTINYQSKIFVEKVRREFYGLEIEISEHVFDFTMKNLLRTLFGLKRIPNALAAQYHKDCMKYQLIILNKMFEIINQRMCKIWLTIDPIFRLSNLYQKAAKHRFDRPNTLSDYLMKDNEKNYLKSHKTGKCETIVDMMYKNREFEEYDDIKSEIDSIIIAVELSSRGYDTTAVMLSNILLMLAIHQDVQKKVISEMKEAFPSNQDEMDIEALGKLSYLEMVINECMRLFPFPPMNVLAPTNDLKLTKCVVPKGTAIMFQPLYFQTSERFWGPDAKMFRPERFTPENYSKVHPSVFIPFLSGPRKCLGYKYAWMVMKIFLCHVLRNFHLSTSMKFEDIYLEAEFILKLKPGWFVKFDDRTDY
ncbi:CLUMA_CG014485, isoform A [Clunio marinus]|uniref:CLUMA_CG014485, isoform A n=1 Tax=Clunio marinus TaxID=568069 RepID=A0A1J1ILK3_9DIPT|nr:CLUMA_CG014485, isoform A [Clunio marinus]